MNFEDIDILRLAGRVELSQTVTCGLTVFAGLIPFKGSTVSETQLAEVPCAHPRFGLCRSRRLSPSFSRVAYLTPRTCPRHPSSLSSSLSPLASPSLSSLVTVDLVRRRHSHPCRRLHPLRSLLVLATIALVAVAFLLSLLLALRWRWLPTYSDAGSLHHARVGSRSHAGSDCQLLAFTV